MVQYVFGRAKCPADPHARRWPKRRPLGRRELAATAGHADRGAILAGVVVSPPGPRRIIDQIYLSYGVIV